MDLALDIVQDAFKDTFALVPFLFVTYLVLEALEHAAGGRVNAVVRRAGAAGPVVGAIAGVFPQCGFSAMGATLYAGRVITLGTLVAVLLSTSDEMLPIFLAEQVDFGLMARILLAKAAIAAVTGIALDVVLRVLRRNARAHAALRATVLGPRVAEEEGAEGLPSHEACGSHCHGDLIDELTEGGEGAAHIHRLCDQDHCGCEDEEPGVAGVAGVVGHGGHGSEHDHAVVADHGHAHDHAHDHGHAHGDGGSALAHILRAALSHTVQVTVFIFLITVVLVALLDTVGEPVLEAFLASNQVLAVFASALVALIPNCAASIVITQLYLEGVLAFGPMMAGSLVGVGIGFLVLFRANRSMRENLCILVLLYALGVAWGLVIMGLGF